MSRPSSVAAARNLTLTEELEKLEQSITLTLQEIDHNFSRAHRIVTSSILPVVEQYAKHSEAVWEGSRFWKQFFEASANVSLSGYEEQQDQPADETDEVDQTATATDPTATGRDGTPEVDEDVSVAGAEESTTTMTPLGPPTSGRRNGSPASKFADVDDSLLSSPSVAHAHSTPRMPRSTGKESSAETPRNLLSPYENLKAELRARGKHTGATADDGEGNITTGSAAPTTPDQTARRPRGEPHSAMRSIYDQTPRSSPFGFPTEPASTAQRNNNHDPLLHRVLDKTYRIAATPHSARRYRPTAPMSALRQRGGLTGGTPGTATRSAASGTLRRWRQTAIENTKDDDDDSPFSSPELAAPQLRAEIFSSPMRQPPPSAGPQRTPGVSVQTPGKGGGGRYGFGREQTGTLWDDSDEDELEAELGFSPPKTIQFHVPQSRLLQTPAREASKQIVEDLLRTAGGDFTDDNQTEDSPSVVRRNMDLDETF